MAEEAAVQTLEQPVEIAPEAAAPVEEPTAPVEGEVAPDAEAGTRVESIKELFKGATVAELRAALDDVSPEVRTELEAEIEKRGEERARVRQQETQTARDGRLGVWKPYADRYLQAEAFLQQSVRRAKGGDLDALANVDMLTAAMDDYRNGAVGRVVLENEAYVSELIDKLLPDLTPEEQKKLDKPLYEFGRTGIAKDVVPLAVELAIERAKAQGFAEGVKKGQQDREAKATLAEKLAKIEEVRKQAAGLPVAGRTVTPEDERTAIRKEIAEFDPTGMSLTEANKKLDELRQRAANVR